MASTKATFTLDERTSSALDRLAAGHGKPKSAIVREAILDYSAREDKLGETERLRLLAEFDARVPKIPRRDAAAVDAELSEIRASRRRGGRRHSDAGESGGT